MATPDLFPADTLDTLRTGTIGFDPVQPASLARGAACAAFGMIGGIPVVLKRPDPRFRDSNQRELAASIVGRYLPGLVNVPPMALRSGMQWPDGTYATNVLAAAFIPDARETPHNPFNLAPAWPHGIPRSDIVGIAMFDMLIGNPDRHPGNILIDSGIPRRLWAIDHGRAFSSHGTFSIALRSVRRTLIPAYIRSFLESRLLPRFDALAVDLSGVLPDFQIESIRTSALAILSERTF